MFEFFFDTKISVIEKSNNFKDERGRLIPQKEEIVYTFMGDVQPISQDRVQKDFGISKSCSLRIFANPNPYIIEGKIIRISGKDYKIERIIAWDTLEFVVSRDDND